MAKYIKTPFAENGDLTAIPDDSQIDGSVSYNAGWGYKYELDPATDANAKRLERQKHNQVFNDVTSNIKEWQEQTFPNWIADVGSGTPFAYSKGTIVTYTDSKKYVSLIDNNTQVPTGINWLEVDFGNFVDKTTNQTIAGIKTFSSTIGGNISGNAGTATKLSIARTLTIAGDANGSTTFDGSANKTISINVLDSEKIGGIPALQATGVNAGTNTQDPNLATNEYILTSHANAPDAGYWHIRTQFYIDKLDTSNRAQIAIKYNGANALYIRARYNQVWSNWERAVTEKDSQALHSTDALRLVGDTLSLYKGDGSSESVTIPASGVGEGQTWANYSRAFNTTYTNTTGRSIMLAVSISGYGLSTQYATLTVSGILVARTGSIDNNRPTKDTLITIVPAGATYIIGNDGSANYSITSCAELR